MKPKKKVVKARSAKTTMKIQLPMLVSVQDYHELDSLEYNLRQLSGNRKINVEELFISDYGDNGEYFDENKLWWGRKWYSIPDKWKWGGYLGLVYGGKKPNIKDILKSRIVEIGW